MISIPTAVLDRHFTIIFCFVSAVATWILHSQIRLPYDSSSELHRRDYDGIGIPVSCAGDITAQLNDTSEINKAGSAAAATLLTLLPALLTFAPLPTANIRELVFVSPWLAFITAGMMLGLPVKQSSALALERILSARQCPCGDNLIHNASSQHPLRHELPAIDASTEHSTVQIPVPDALSKSPSREESPVLDESPEGITGDGTPNTQQQQCTIIDDTSAADSCHSQCLKRKIFPDQATVHETKIFIVFATIIGFGVCHIILFIIILSFLPTIDSFTIIWKCNYSPHTWYFIWLAFAFLISGIVVMFTNSSYTNPQLMFHLRSIPTESQRNGYETNSQISFPGSLIQKYPLYHPFNWVQTLNNILGIMHFM
jgi:hypothetical protein